MRSPPTLSTRRAALLAAALASSRTWAPLPAHADAADFGRLKGLEDTSLQAFDKVPLAGLQLPCVNFAGKQSLSLSDYFSRGQYVVLWIFPEDGIGLETKNNELEARNFEKLKSEFDDLDAVVLGCSSQPLSRLRELVDRQKLTLPFVSDPSRDFIRLLSLIHI